MHFRLAKISLLLAVAAYTIPCAWAVEDCSPKFGVRIVNGLKVTTPENFDEYIPSAQRAYAPGWVHTGTSPVGNFGKELFERTNRGVRELIAEGQYPRWTFSRERISGRKILDVGTGDGQTVHDLRALGADAYGLDLALRNQQKLFPFFIEGSATELPFEDGTLDDVFSSMSVFTIFYKDALSDADMAKSVKEVARVLKVGGIFHFSNPSERTLRLLDEMPEMEIVRVHSHHYPGFGEAIKLPPGVAKRKWTFPDILGRRVVHSHDGIMRVITYGTQNWNVPIPEENFEFYSLSTVDKTFKVESPFFTAPNPEGTSGVPPIVAGTLEIILAELEANLDPGATLVIGKITPERSMYLEQAAERRRLTHGLENGALVIQVP